MKRGFEELLHHEMFQHLFRNEASPVYKRIESIRKRIAHPGCKWEETIALRGELAGLLEVYAAVEQLAKDESFPNDHPPTAQTKRLTEIAGFRDRFSARAS
jgi:hypothetical protein